MGVLPPSITGVGAKIIFRCPYFAWQFIERFVTLMALDSDGRVSMNVGTSKRAKVVSFTSMRKKRFNNFILSSSEGFGTMKAAKRKELAGLGIFEFGFSV